MCLSAPASFAAWSIGVVTASILFARNRINDLWMGAFVLIFTMVQFFEGLIWLQEGNAIWTRAIIIVLMLEPLVQTLGALGTIYFQYPRRSRFWTWLILDILLFLLLVFFLWNVVYMVLYPNTYSSTECENHLQWKRSSGSLFVPRGGVYLFILGLLLPLLFMEPIWKGLLLSAYGALTLLVSYLLSGCSAPSIWCFMACGFGVLAVALSFL